MMHMEGHGAEHLEKYQFKPGESGHTRAKRPIRKVKHRALPDLPQLLAECLSATLDGKSAMKLILEALRERAIAGDIRAAELLLDRSYGKTPQTIEVNKTERQYILIRGQKLEF